MGYWGTVCRSWVKKASTRKNSFVFDPPSRDRVFLPFRTVPSRSSADLDWAPLPTVGDRSRDRVIDNYQRYRRVRVFFAAAPCLSRAELGFCGAPFGNKSTKWVGLRLATAAWNYGFALKRVLASTRMPSNSGVLRGARGNPSKMFML